jgi:sugar O-acyltransferase (sialic acid O-acetyltransferase NeuD family)
MTNQINIIGCGGHARSVADILLSNTKDTSIVFIDSSAHANEKIVGYPVLANKEISNNEKTFIAIGDNQERYQYFSKHSAFNYINIISSKAYISPFAKIQSGIFIGNFVHIGPEASIGPFTILNNGAIIEHEVTIGAFSHIAPNVAISGRCHIGDQVFVGVGATIKNNVRICSNVIIGAGSTVIHDITEPGTYIGTPAKRIK